MIIESHSYTTGFGQGYGEYHTYLRHKKLREQQTTAAAKIQPGRTGVSWSGMHIFDARDTLSAQQCKIH